MKIAASSVDFSASHSASRSDEVHESLRAWVGDHRPEFEKSDSTTQATATQASAVATLSAAAQAAIKSSLNMSSSKAAADPPAAASAASPDINQDSALDNDPRFSFIRLMLEMMTGQKLHLVSASDLQRISQAAPADNTATAVPAPQKAGFGIEYDRTVVHDESESATFQANGVVRTEDGRQVQFNLSFNMQRSAHSESTTSVREGDAVRKDPLVINFGSGAVRLGDQRFSFDIDSDGKADKLAGFTSDSAYLALDLNQNGKIDRGTELFGAGSGDGFADLARHDSNGNGWIDENDAVFAALRVWSPGADGDTGKLETLAERRVGALYLGKVATPFELRGSADAGLGAVRASGTWLKENGEAGSLQQIDLLV